MTNDEISPEWTMIDLTPVTTDIDILSEYLWLIGVAAIEEIESASGNTLRTCVGDSPLLILASIEKQFPDVLSNVVGIPRIVADTWRQFAEPTWVTTDLALVPAWLDAPDNCIPIFIEPLDTFGLGNHPTTILALQESLTHIADGSIVVDVGCGSGVLGIAVSLLRDSQVFVFDIADSAQHAVRINSERNGATKITWTPDWESVHAQVVLANILAPVLQELSTSIQQVLENDGLVVLSGMRTEQVDNVLNFYEQCVEISRSTLEGWTAVTLRKIS